MDFTLKFKLPMKTRNLTRCKFKLEINSDHELFSSAHPFYVIVLLYSQSIEWSRPVGQWRLSVAPLNFRAYHLWFR
jgi:hypothetical protein